MKPAQVILKVTQFRDAIYSRARNSGTLCDMAMGEVHDKVEIIQKGNKKNLSIKGSGTPIRFSIVSANDPTDIYHPLGIAFQRKGKFRSDKNCDLLGKKNFTRREINLAGGFLEIVDSGSFRGCGKKKAYKLSVFLQREHDGKLGIIDPGIEHDNSS
jgi:hypothetical protein